MPQPSARQGKKPKLAPAVSSLEPDSSVAGWAQGSCWRADPQLSLPLAVEGVGVTRRDALDCLDGPDDCYLGIKMPNLGIQNRKSAHSPGVL